MPTLLTKHGWQILWWHWLVVRPPWLHFKFFAEGVISV